MSNPIATTENGAITNSSTGSNLLNFYFEVGSARSMSKHNPGDLVTLFKLAYLEDKLSALKILFYMRDIRGGQGERNAFRVILKYFIENVIFSKINGKPLDRDTNKNDKQLFNTLFALCREYGRVDDYIDTIQDIIRSKKFNDTATTLPTHKKIQLNRFINLLVGPISSIIFTYIRNDIHKLNGVVEPSSVNKKLVEQSINNLNKDVIKYEDRILFKWIPRQEYLTRLILNKVSSTLSKYYKLRPVKVKTNNGKTNSKKTIYNKSVLIDRKSFRKLLVRCSDTVEQKIANKDYDNIDLSRVSSLSLRRHWTHLNNKIKDRIEQFLSDLKSGKVSVNAATLYPYDVIKTINSNEYDLANAQWKSLTDFLTDTSNLNILPMIDVSGSMSSPEVMKDVSPMDVAISLGVYLAERNTNSEYKNKFLTFDSVPQLLDFSNKYNGDNFTDLYKYVKSTPWGGGTNFHTAMKLIADNIKSNPQSSVPDAIICFSDMEFDESGADRTNFDGIKSLFDGIDCKIPNIIFWNLAKKTRRNFPIKRDDVNVLLVSGFSPSTLKVVVNSISSGSEINPMVFLNDTINQVRYDDVNELYKLINN